MDAGGLRAAHTGPLSCFLWPRKKKASWCPSLFLHLLPFSSIPSTLITCPLVGPAIHDCSLCHFALKSSPSIKTCSLPVGSQAVSKPSSLEGVWYRFWHPQDSAFVFKQIFFFLFYHFFEAFCQGIPRAILAEEYESLAPGQVLMGQDNIGDKDPHPSACIAEETKPALHACQSA